MVNASTGRVHTTFAQAVAVTGRLSSNEPNLQNIPVRTAEGRRIREAFVAPPGHVILSADYSQIELRIMAHLSEDPALVHAFHGRPRHPQGDGGRDLRRDARRSDERPAPLHQGGQLRPHLRHERVRPRAAARHRAQRGGAVHRQVLRAVSGRRAVHAAHAGDGARQRFRRNGVRAAALASRHQCRRRSAPRGGGTRGDQRADAGHGGGSHQARDDRGAPVARPREARAPGSSCRCTTSSCSKCRMARSRR